MFELTVLIISYTLIALALGVYFTLTLWIIYSLLVKSLIKHLWHKFMVYLNLIGSVRCIRRTGGMGGPQ